MREALPATTTKPGIGIPTPGGALNISWTRDDDAIEYKVYYRRKDGIEGEYPEHQKVATTTDATQTTTIDELTNNIDYCFAVTTIHSDSTESEYSDEACAAPDDTKPPSAPVITEVTPGNGQVTLTWDTNPHETVEYQVYYLAGTYNSYQNRAIPKEKITDTQYTVPELNNDTTYTFWVTAIDDSENAATSSATSTIQI